MDAKIVQVALNGLENILRLGEQDAKQNNGTNPYAVMIEECFGMYLVMFICIRQCGEPAWPSDQGHSLTLTTGLTQLTWVWFRYSC